MAHPITLATRFAAASQHARPVLLVEIELDSSVYRHNTIDRNIDYDGNTYYGVGSLSYVSPYTETLGDGVEGLKIGLTGIPSQNIDIALGEQVQGRPVRIYLGFLDSDYDLIADPVLVFMGKADFMSFPAIGETFTVELSVESRLADWDRDRIRRYTHADQQTRYPGDLGFEYVSEATEVEIDWGERR